MHIEPTKRILDPSSLAGAEVKTSWGGFGQRTVTVKGSNKQSYEYTFDELIEILGKQVAEAKKEGLSAIKKGELHRIKNDIVQLMENNPRMIDIWKSRRMDQLDQIQEEIVQIRDDGILYRQNINEGRVTLTFRNEEKEKEFIENYDIKTGEEEWRHSGLADLTLTKDENAAYLKKAAAATNAVNAANYQQKFNHCCKSNEVIKSPKDNYQVKFNFPSEEEREKFISNNNKIIKIKENEKGWRYNGTSTQLTLSSQETFDLLELKDRRSHQTSFNAAMKLIYDKQEKEHF